MINNQKNIYQSIKTRIGFMWPDVIGVQLLLFLINPLIELLDYFSLMIDTAQMN